MILIFLRYMYDESHFYNLYLFSLDIRVLFCGSKKVYLDIGGAVSGIRQLRDKASNSQLYLTY